MKLTNRQIVETYKYNNERERDAHSEEMIQVGWKIRNNSLLNTGLILTYTKNEKPE